MEAALKAARFLTRKAWNPAAKCLPFELDPPRFAYFFDCGIVIRGLLAAGRATGEGEFFETAKALGEAMATDFAAPGGGFHPILSLPDKQPLPEDKLRWSQAGCRDPGGIQNVQVRFDRGERNLALRNPQRLYVSRCAESGDGGP